MSAYKKSAFLLHLNEDWSLSYDRNQWIIQQRRNRRDETYWQPVAFIGSEKSNLWRDLREKGVEVSPKAKAEIRTWPERFLDWRTQYAGDAACSNFPSLDLVPEAEE